MDPKTAVGGPKLISMTWTTMAIKTPPPLMAKVKKIFHFCETYPNITLCYALETPSPLTTKVIQIFHFFVKPYNIMQFATLYLYHSYVVHIYLPK